MALMLRPQMSKVNFDQLVLGMSGPVLELYVRSMGLTTEGGNEQLISSNRTWNKARIRPAWDTTRRHGLSNWASGTIQSIRKRRALSMTSSLLSPSSDRSTASPVKLAFSANSLISEQSMFSKEPKFLSMSLGSLWTSPIPMADFSFCSRISWQVKWALFNGEQ